MKMRFGMSLRTSERLSHRIAQGDTLVMEQANSLADQMASKVFWIVMLTTVAFVAAALILIH